MKLPDGLESIYVTRPADSHNSSFESGDSDDSTQDSKTMIINVVIYSSSSSSSSLVKVTFIALCTNSSSGSTNSTK